MAASCYTRATATKCLALVSRLTTFRAAAFGGALLNGTDLCSDTSARNFQRLAGVLALTVRGELVAPRADVFSSLAATHLQGPAALAVCAAAGVHMHVCVSVGPPAAWAESVALLASLERSVVAVSSTADLFGDLTEMIYSFVFVRTTGTATGSPTKIM